jgi:hypothetical protein
MKMILTHTALHKLLVQHAKALPEAEKEKLRMALLHWCEQVEGKQK